MSSNLVAHKSGFRLRGKLNGMSGSNFHSEGVNKKGKSWQRIFFQVQTSPDSKISVELMANEMEKAYAYNKSKKKSMAIDWSKRKSTLQNLPKGYQYIEPDWDLIERIKKDFNDGDDVVIVGEIQYSEYNDRPQYKLVVKRMFKSSEEIDFEKDNFEEENEFWQELTVIDVDKNKDENKIYLTAHIIQDRGKDNLPDLQTAVFIVDPDTDKDWTKTVLGFKYGDTFKAYGIINNRIITEEDSTSIKGWGKYKKMVSGRQIKELQILGGDNESFEKKKYKESDFAEVKEIKEKQKEVNQFAETNEENDAPWED